MFRIRWRKWISARPRPARRTGYRPNLEALEDRAAPATHVWSGTAGNLMSVDSNWSSGGHPSNGETAPIVLVFPQMQVAQSVVDDIAGLNVDQIQFTGAPYFVSGTGVALNLTGLATRRPNINDQVGGNEFSASGLTLNLLATTVLNVQGGTLAINSVISGAGGMQKTGDGTASLSAGNLFAGGTTVSGGTLLVSNTQALGSGAVTMAGGTLELADGSLGGQIYSNNVIVTASSTIDVETSPAAMGPLTIGTATLTVLGNGPSLSSGPPLTLGPTTLTGNPTFFPGPNFGETLYLGSVTSNLPTATITLAGPGIVDMDNVPGGVTLAGSGKIGQAITINSGATVNPSNPTGVTGSINAFDEVFFQSGSTYAVDLRAPGFGSFDQLAVGGSVDLNNDAGAGATLKVTLASGFSFLKNQSFTIIQNYGSSPISGTFAGLPDGAIFAAGGVDFAISYVGGSGHDVVLTEKGLSVATHFGVTTTTTTAPAGSTVVFTVKALDDIGAVVTNYTGTVNFTSNDALAILPANGATLTGGAGAFNVIFRGAGANTTLTVKDSVTNSITGTSSGVTVTALACNHFAVITGASYLPGVAFVVTVNALDQFNNLATSYTGTVRITSTDSSAILPSPGTLTAGTSSFPVTLNASGVYQVTASDTFSFGITGSALVSYSPPPPVLVDHFAIIRAPSSVTAGVPFFLSIAAFYSDNSLAQNYAGTVFVMSNSTVLAAGTCSYGVGTFALTLTTVTGAPVTLTAKDSVNPQITPAATNVTITPGAVSFFTVIPATGTQTTGVAFNTTVTAKDAYGNTVTGFSRSVKLTSSDPAASTLVGSYTFSIGDAGVHTFSTTLKTAGTQTITATITPPTVPIVTGTSGPITVRGLTVKTFTPTATGFSATFSKPFDPSKITMYGAGAAVQDVTLTGAATGFPISGTLIVDPTNTAITFKATAIPLDFMNTVVIGGADSVVLPDDTYTVVIKSGTASNGFVDLLGANLDGAGNAGHADYTAAFTTHYQSSATPILGIPDFARGPDDNSTIKLPNNQGHGIPITLYNAALITDVTFTLSYDPTLLTIAGGLGGAGSDATDPASSFQMVLTPGVVGQATFTYHDATAKSGRLVLGDILAMVPSTAKTSYKSKQLLQLGAITVTSASDQPSVPVVPAPGIHVNAYFGDVSGDGVLGAADVNPMFTVAVGTSTGFSPFSLTDPEIIADITADASVDGGDVATLKSYILHLPRPAIPTPPGLTGIVSPNAADPTLDLRLKDEGGRMNRTGDPSHPSSFILQTFIDDPHPDGSTGLTEAILALKYDPAVLSVAPEDIALGSIPGLAGWKLRAVVDAAAGLIGIEMLGSTPIASTEAGSLVNIAFHVLPQATASTTAVQLLDGAVVSGEQLTTLLADAQGGLVVSTWVRQIIAELA